ncbi:MAG: glycosyltransferase family 4 protein [Hyphomicrobium sp.]
MRLGIVASHPIQYYAPLYRELARRIDLKVYFAHRASAADQAGAGFDVAFEWDSDLLGGYLSEFLENVAAPPALSRFGGCDTPDVGARFDADKIDAVLVQGWHLKSYLQATFAAKRRGLPVFVRGDSQLETPRSRLKTTIKAATYPAFLRLFDAALYVGQRSKAYWLHYRYRPECLIFSPHCVDTNWFASRATSAARAEWRKRLGIDAGADVALFAGKLVARKRPLDLIAAISTLKDQNRQITAIVAGAGALHAEMAAVAQSRGVDIRFLGFCNQSDMPAAYAASDVLVLPSDGSETWGLVANEALACGRPIVVSDACGCSPDLAGDGEAGISFPVGNVELLADALAKVTLQPPPPAAIARRSQEYGMGAAANGIESALCQWARRSNAAVRN